MPRYSDELLESMIGVFDGHLAEPDVSLAQHIARRKAELAENVLERTRVYLDLKFWIFLRDALLGTPQHPLHQELLETLRAGVADGRLLCPINESTFFELARQHDEKRRMASVRLIDELSLGVVIQNTVDRVGTEVHDFIKECVRRQKIPGVPLDRVWLKIGHFLGTPAIKSEGYSIEQELAAQKTLADGLWRITLQEMMDDTPLPEDLRRENEKLAERLTRQSRQHQDELENFQQVYEAELAGFWDVYEKPVTDVLVHLFQKASTDNTRISNQVEREQTSTFKNALRNIVVLGDSVTCLPTSQVVSGLHAVVRWNKNRGFKAGDFYDFHHAAAAVPYCDLFLTEGFLRKELNNPPLAFAERFGTTVVSDEIRALEAISP